MYKLGTLKLPKLIKKYRNGRTIEQESTFRSLEHEGTRVIAMTPYWDTYTPELQNWQNDILYHQDYQYLDFVEDLLP
jgi:hypothetical protein